MLVLIRQNHEHPMALYFVYTLITTRETTYLIFTGIWYIYIKPMVVDQVLYSYRMHTDYPYAYVRIDRVIDR